jgi:hypothetical protein
MRMINRFTHHALGLGEETIPKVNAVKPRLKSL